jgi:hypothetical protein
MADNIINRAISSAVNFFPSVKNYVTRQVTAYQQAQAQKEVEKASLPYVPDALGRQPQVFTDSGQPVINPANAGLNRFVPALNIDPARPAWENLARQFNITNPVNTASAAAFGALSNAVGSLLNKQAPTLEQMSQGAEQAMNNAWVYKLTNPLTDKILGGLATKLPGLKPLTDASLASSQQLLQQGAREGIKETAKRALPHIFKTTAREALESPLETAFFTASDNYGTDTPYGEAYKERFLEDLLGNVAFGGIKGVTQASIPLMSSGKASLNAKAQAPVSDIKVYIDPLLEEARKYKSAEEFIKAQGMPVYRGGYYKEGQVSGKYGTPTTVDKNIAQQYADVSPFKKVVELVIDKNAKILDYKDIPKELFHNENWVKEDLVYDYAKANGYDAIDLRPSGGKFLSEQEIKVINPAVLKTTQELTDIYNQATKGVVFDKSQIKSPPPAPVSDIKASESTRPKTLDELLQETDEILKEKVEVPEVKKPVEKPQDESKDFSNQELIEMGVKNLTERFNLTKPQQELARQRMSQGDVTEQFVKLEEILRLRAERVDKQPFTPSNPNASQPANQPKVDEGYWDSLFKEASKMQPPKQSLDDIFAKIDKGTEQKLRVNIETTLRDMGFNTRADDKAITQNLDRYFKKLGYRTVGEAYQKFLKDPQNQSAADFWRYLKNQAGEVKHPNIVTDIDPREADTRKRLDDIMAGKHTSQPSKEAQPKTAKPSLIERLKTMKTKEEVTSFYKEADAYLTDFDKKYSIAKTAKDIENKVDNDQTKELISFMEKIRERAIADGVDVGKLEDYFPRMTEDTAQELLSKDLLPQTMGELLTKPQFSKKRTGKLKNYIYSLDAVRAYVRDMTRNSAATPSQKAEIKVTQEIQAESKSHNKVIDFVSKVEKLADPNAPKKQYDEKSVSSLFNSVSDRAAFQGEARKGKGTNEFWSDFIYPFRKAELELKDEVEKLLKLYGKGGELEKWSNPEKFADRILSARREVYARAFDEFKENVKNAEFKSLETKKLINDIFDEYGTRELREADFAEKLMATIRSQTARGALGLNLASAIQNLFETKRVLALVDGGALARGMRNIAKGTDYVAKYTAHPEIKKALDQKYNNSVIGKAGRKLDKGLFFLFDNSERFKDNVMLAAFEEQGKAKGLKGEELTKFVLQHFDQYAIKPGKGQDIGLFKNDIVKTIFQFNQYAVKDVKILLDKSKGALKGNRGDTEYVAKYILSSIVQSLLLQKLIGQIGFGGKTGTPVDVIMDLMDGKVPVSPAFQTQINLHAYATLDEDASENEKYTTKRDLTRSFLTATTPASNQLIFKSGLQSALGSELVDELLPYGDLYMQKQGYHTTTGGNVAHELSTDPWSRVKSFTLGTGYDPKRQEYFKASKRGEEPYLNKAESDVYRSLSKEERTAFYTKSATLDKEKKAFNDYIKSVDKPKEKSLADFFKTKEKPPASISLPEDGATAKEVKDARARIKILIDRNMPLSDEQASYYFFKGKTANDKSIATREEVYKNLLSAINNEDYSDELKTQLLTISGVDEETFNYYRLASNSNLEGREQVVNLINQNQDKPEAVAFALALLRKRVGNKQVLSSDDLTYLYERDYITEDEKNFFSALEYDELEGKFYVKKSYKGIKAGTSLTKAQIKKLTVDLTVKPVKNSLNSYFPQTPSWDTSKAQQKLLDEILRS